MMMGWRVRLLNGGEEDAITGWRYVTGHKPGTRKRIKRGIRRRDRQQQRRAMRRVRIVR